MKPMAVIALLPWAAAPFTAPPALVGRRHLLVQKSDKHGMGYGRIGPLALNRVLVEPEEVNPSPAVVGSVCTTTLPFDDPRAQHVAHVLRCVLFFLSRKLLSI